MNQKSPPTHPFGRLLRQHLSRGNNLNYRRLAEGTGIPQGTITLMSQGERLTGRQARGRVMTIIDWLRQQETLDTRAEADALLAAAGMLGLGVGPAPEGEQQLAAAFDALALAQREQAAVSRPEPPAEPALMMVPNLPVQGIYGRDDTLQQIAVLLELQDAQARDVPPVALRGLGGIGKTTLAVALGRSRLVAQAFPDGVLWVALGPQPTIRSLLDRWGRDLGLDLLPERDEEACHDRLRTWLHNRQALLLVDDVWETHHGRYFNLAGPRGRMLFTTRELTVASDLATRDRTLIVNVLKPHPALQLLRKLAPAAVAQDEQHAKRLCERLEYLPLALTLAGRLLTNEADVPGRMKRLIDELIEHRDARLKLLQSEKRLGIEEEQPSLQAILGMSIERLNTIDQQRFAMLSTFGGDPLTWEINAAAYVWECSLDEAETTVVHFVQRGLVEPRSTRYWMHALLADYADELREQMGL